MAKKILWLDSETSGLDPKRHAIVQLAMLMDINGEVVDKLTLNIKPQETDMVNFVMNDKPQEMEWDEIQFMAEAIGNATLPVNGISFKDMIGYLDPMEAHKQIVEFLDKYIDKFNKEDKAWIGGYNVRFDLDFLAQFFEKCEDKFLGSYIKWRCLDPYTILQNNDYKANEHLKSLSLENVCKEFELEHTAHDALSDIEATRHLWFKLMGIEELHRCEYCADPPDVAVIYSKIRNRWLCKQCWDVNIGENN